MDKRDRLSKPAIKILSFSVYAKIMRTSLDKKYPDLPFTLRNQNLTLSGPIGGLRGPDGQTHSCQSETSYPMMPKLGDF